MKEKHECIIEINRPEAIITSWDYFDGGGEKKGIEGMVVGRVGMEGIVVGMPGREVAGNGGSVIFGIEGMVGRVGSPVGNGLAVGNGGNVAVGRVGIVGNGGSVTLGKAGIVGTACKRCLAARVS